MENRVEIFTITKEGTLLSKYSILGSDESEKDQLISGFLMALNSFAKDIGFPAGVSLIRSGNLEARFSAGEYVFSVLIIDYSMPLGLMTEPILSGMAQELTSTFEDTYKDRLKLGIEQRIYKSNDYKDFHFAVNKIIDKYGKETQELYQKLVLIEALYSKVPQKWILPLLEKVSNGKNVINKLLSIPKKYHPQIISAAEKVYFDSKPLWEIFAIETFNI